MDAGSTGSASTQGGKTRRPSKSRKKTSRVETRIARLFRPPARQEFDVTYVRKPDSSRWTATTRRGQLRSGIKAKGAVGYTTGKWEGEREGEENHAIVTVLVECDSTMCDASGRLRSTAWPAMTATARHLADKMFKTRHFDAVIEHVGNGS